MGKTPQCVARLGAPTALLLALLASFVNPPMAAETRRMAMDAREIMIESPHLLQSAPAPVAARAPLQIAPPPHRHPAGACEESAFDFCFDSADRRIVYRAARQHMPTVDGVTAEGISLRRHAIRFNYSFR
jgi:hypothetical protein